MIESIQGKTASYVCAIVKSRVTVLTEAGHHDSGNVHVEVAQKAVVVVVVRRGVGRASPRVICVVVVAQWVVVICVHLGSDDDVNLRGDQELRSDTRIGFTTRGKFALLSFHNSCRKVVEKFATIVFLPVADPFTLLAQFSRVRTATSGLKRDTGRLFGNFKVLQGNLFSQQRFLSRCAIGKRFNGPIALCTQSRRPASFHA